MKMISLIAVAFMLVSLDAYMPVTNKIFRPNARAFATKDGIKTLEKATRVSMKSVAGLALALAGLLTSAGPAAAILADVMVTNYTDNYAEVKIQYTGTGFFGVCKGDDLSIFAGQTVSASRGACLITRVTAEVMTPDGDVVNAVPWTSPSALLVGLPASKFSIYKAGDNNYKVE
jgi:hypothetical protein